MRNKLSKRIFETGSRQFFSMQNRDAKWNSFMHGIAYHACWACMIPRDTGYIYIPVHDTP